MSRTRRILLGTAAVIVAVPVLVVAGLNIGPGRIAAEQLIARVTGGQVRLTGLHGRFPDALRVAHAEIWDGTGAWLLADDIALDWSPTALVRRRASVQVLSAGRLQVPRLAAAAPGPAPASTPFSLPVAVQIDRLRLDRVELGAPVAGVAAVLAVDGGGSVRTLDDGQVTLAVHRVDRAGEYRLTGLLDGARVKADLDLAEPAGGLVSQVAGSPDLGALHLAAALDGPRQAVRTNVTLSAGALRAEAHGTVDSVGQTLALDVTGQAPAMAPRADVRWDSVAVQAHVAGPFTTPDVRGSVKAAGLAAAGAGVRSLDADIQGNAGQVSVHAVAERVTLPAPALGLLEAAPLVLDAGVQLNQAARPARFSLAHPLFGLTGTADTAAALVDARLDLPDLAPFARLVAQDLRGHAAITVKGGASHLELGGVLALLPGAPNVIQGLLGPDAHLAAVVDRAGGVTIVSGVNLQGQALGVTGGGTMRDDAAEGKLHVALPRLAVLAPQLQGSLELDGNVTGALDALVADVAGRGSVTVPGVPTGPLTFKAHATGLPGAPTGRLTLQGALVGAPVDLALDVARGAAGVQARIERADWKSVHAEGALSLAPGAVLPRGDLKLRAGRLGDLDPFVGQALSGSVVADAVLEERSVRLTLEARDAGSAAGRAGHATLQARVAEPATRPVVDAALVAEGISAGPVSGGLKLDVAGPQNALAVRTSGALRISGTDTQLSGTATVDGVKRVVQLATLQAVAKGETVRLLAPAVIKLADGVSVDRLRLGMRQAVLDVAGRLSPALDATVSLRGPADTLAAFAPAADGQVGLDAVLKGSPAAPRGTVKLAATGVRARSGPGRGLPPANLNADVVLNGGSAQVDARLLAGSAARLNVSGRAPIGAGALDLKAQGALDLALLDPILTASGRQARGRVVIDGGAAGTLAQPRLSGTVQLAGADIQDFTQGLRISGINGTLRADGDRLLIQDVRGQAGPGTIGLSGSAGLGLEGSGAAAPLDIAIQLRNARPLASDRLTAELDGDVTVRGTLAAPVAGGTITVRRAEIQIPDRLPASVAVLDVRRPGQKPPAPAAATTAGLDLTVQAPRGIFVRGRGLDAEMGGTLHLRGNSAAPDVGGGFEMRRGTISVAGTTLSFTRGKVGFDGTGVTGKIDPTLDFAADSVAGGVTATLGIGGYASAPKIKLSSVPDLPQDEVLAYLLFKRSSKDLGPFQLAEIAAALASLTGAGGGVGNPLESVRRGLGLDRLSVGGGQSGSSTASSAPTVEAGRYVGNGVYVGAKQGTTGGQTGATVQIDISKGLKLETDVGTGTGTGTGTNSVGLSYQFEY